MKVSIVMATYNGAEYLIEQLDSIRLQNHVADEVIICDDVSSDRTPDIVDDYILRYQLENTWTLYRNEKNLGYADNFFKALDLATGDLIFFADQDDVWLPEKLEESVSVMEKNPRIQLLCSDFEPLVSTEDAPKLNKKVIDSMVNDESLEEIPLTNKNIFIGSLGCVMCLRKSFRDMIRSYWFSGWAHDEYVWKLAQCMRGCYRYHKVLIQRRLHSNNVSMKKYHDMNKRIRFLELLEKSHIQTYRFAKNLQTGEKELRLIQNNIKSVRLRLKLLNGNLWIVPITFFYWPYYHSVKSLLMEPYMAIRYKARRGNESADI